MSSADGRLALGEGAPIETDGLAARHLPGNSLGVVFVAPRLVLLEHLRIVVRELIKREARLLRHPKGGVALMHRVGARARGAVREEVHAADCYEHGGEERRRKERGRPMPEPGRLGADDWLGDIATRDWLSHDRLLGVGHAEMHARRY